MEGRASSVGRLIGICAVLALAACSGGGGGGDGTVPQGTPLLVRIEAEGTPGSLWEFPGATPPGCAAGVPRNGRLLFTFNGRVDPASVPPPGPADGAIRISLPGGVAPSVGFFATADDPALAPGNGRRVVFTPLSPTDLGDPNSGGYVSPAAYEVEVRGGASPGPRISIGHAPIAASAITCFDPCLRPAGAPASTCLADPVPGPPFVTETWPPMGFAPPPPIDADALTAGSPLNPVSTLNDTFPAIQEISIHYETPTGCP